MRQNLRWNTSAITMPPSGEPGPTDPAPSRGDGFPGRRLDAVSGRRSRLLPWLCPRRHTLLAATVAVLAAAALTACTATASPGTTGGTAAAPGASAGPGAGASSPPATETNPPGDIPDTQAFVPVTPARAPVTLTVPEGWARTESASGTVFNDKLNRIQVTTAAAGQAPTVASVTGTDLPSLRSRVPNFTPGQVTADTRPAGPVIVTTYQGDSPVDPVTGKVVREAFERYTYFKNGTSVDVTLSGPVNADNVDPWRKVTDSVRWTA